MALLIDKHAKYFQLCLHSLPLKAQTEDSNKLALIYFSLHGLSLMGKLEKSSETPEHIQYIYEHMIPLKDDTIQAFRPSQTFALAPENNEYDLPNLSATFFALVIFLVLEEDFLKKIDRHKIMAFVSQCQLKAGPHAGSFLPVLGPQGTTFGESDLRLCYIAASIRKILGYDKLSVAERQNDIDVESMRRFILDKVNFNGGLASYSHTESHSGLTFCGIAALKLIGHEFLHHDSWTQLTVEWLVHRQVDFPADLYKEEYDFYCEGDTGGFNGRENKFGDTCYSWWVMALLLLIDKSHIQLIDERKACDYLLQETQHKLMGGFGKDAQAFPDPFHSFLALASLTLVKDSFVDLQIEGFESLDKIDPELVITNKSRMFMETLW
ncbi:terpenoid cyclases/Protein prenyltransferase [Metschnikowia bicuspidata var. bicuspidata NRRL YB-4993]|uniref:Terpenoid cyclases/Protein prenyltransferase n=1 Tax=Metschnikowia bicuspidata var. bicuspidata NRRL YB-4993 TaxID=869754 RepID=A0A1A0H207_9ASCO|nr:terpenoid cyclases/Protein prenyltransferase [Metschnikowia bicuspidata var. bicuspidata NRRL YB-4993]OBA17957.1 terpenoid cyclases/Protein prenyltransferase [Metschnikowia bicuspidata var. bicuspidata NRRL YB-4993]